MSQLNGPYWTTVTGRNRVSRAAPKRPQSTLPSLSVDHTSTAVRAVVPTVAPPSPMQPPTTSQQVPTVSQQIERSTERYSPPNESFDLFDNSSPESIDPFPHPPEIYQRSQDSNSIPGNILQTVRPIPRPTGVQQSISNFHPVRPSPVPSVASVYPNMGTIYPPQQQLHQQMNPIAVNHHHIPKLFRSNPYILWKGKESGLKHAQYSMETSINRIPSDFRLSEQGMTAFLQLRDLLRTFSNSVYLYPYWFGIATISIHPQTVVFPTPEHQDHYPQQIERYITYLETLPGVIPEYDSNIMFPPSPLYVMHVTPKQLMAIDAFTNVAGVQVIQLLRSSNNTSGLENIANAHNALDNNDLVQILRNLHEHLFARNGLNEKVRLIQSLFIHPYKNAEDLIRHIDSVISLLHLHNDHSQDNNQCSVFYASISQHYPEIYSELLRERWSHITARNSDWT